MFYGLGVLKLIEKANPQVNSLANLEGHVALSYYLGVFAFVVLVPYIWNTLEMLKPSTVIGRLAEEITGDNILKSIDKKSEKSGDKDPIQPIIDIVNGSVMKYDYETLRIGLRAIINRTSQILKNTNLNEDEGIKISEHTLVHLDRVGRLTIRKKDSYFTFEIIAALKQFGLKSIEQRRDDVTWRIVWYLGELGKAAAMKHLEDETCWILFDLGDLGSAAAKNNLPNASLQTVRHLGSIGKEAAEKELVEAASFAASSLYNVGTASAHIEGVTKESIEYLELILKAYPIDKKHESAICKVIESIGWIGKVSVENNSDYRIEFLAGIGKKASEENLDDAACKTATSLQLIAKVSPNHQLKWNVIEAQSEIGKISAKRGLNATTGEVAMSIGSLGSEVSDDQKLKALEFLEEIGISACKHGALLCYAIRRVVLSLSGMGKTVMESHREHEKVALKAISSLEKVGRACEQNCNDVARRTVDELKELRSIINEDNKPTEIGRRILLRLNQAISKFEK